MIKVNRFKSYSARHPILFIKQPKKYAQAKIVTRLQLCENNLQWAANTLKKKNQRETVIKTPYFRITEPHTFEVVLIRLCFKEIPRTLEKHARAGVSGEARQESGPALI